MTKAKAAADHIRNLQTVLQRVGYKEPPQELVAPRESERSELDSGFLSCSSSHDGDRRKGDRDIRGSGIGCSSGREGFTDGRTEKQTNMRNAAVASACDWMPPAESTTGGV